MGDIRLIFENSPEIGVKVRSDHLCVDLSQELSIIPPTRHSDLLGLDYEASGHTGFASAEALSVLVPKRLNVLPRSALRNRDALVYVDNDGTPEHATMRGILDTKIRTATTIPDDFQQGDYIFLEVQK